MGLPQPLASGAPWWGERGQASETGSERVGAEVEVAPVESHPWRVIWLVGGLCWLVVTGTALLWMLPASGTTMSGMYVVTTEARAVQHLLVFLAAASAYRLAIALGWPGSLWSRARVAAINTLLALAVVSFSQIALALVAGFIDRHTVEMHDTLDSWAPFSPRWESWAMPLRFFLPPYVLGLCAIALVLVTHRHHREALRAAKLASAYEGARMAMLSAQLQPHFLFNSLHAVSVLIDDSPRQAATMLARLGDFLRHVLESSHWAWVDVATELAGLEAYLAVQQTRFSDQLSVSIDASPEALGVYVPSLLLQPLAENAIEHGRGEGGPSLRVRVATWVRDGRLGIAVGNSSPRLARPLSAGDYGHGLRNVELRLRAAYGRDAHLTVGPDAQGGTSAVLDLPLRWVPGVPVSERARA
ncbi:MAG TPA: histidine kinase [Steroidobacteraceae bacterium]|nr:histidine kinase [Steroidobacteraceae bacterium]